MIDLSLERGQDEPEPPVVLLASEACATRLEVSLRDYQRRVAQEKRAAVVEAAREHFQARGYAETSLEDVARAAGVSTATVYKHFPTKAALFEAAAESLFPEEPLPHPAPEEEDTWSQVEAVLFAYAEMLTRPAAPALFRVMVAEPSATQELAGMLERRAQAPFVDRLKSLLGPKQLDEQDDLDLIVGFLLSMLKGCLFWPRLVATSDTWEAPPVSRVVAEAMTWLRARLNPSAAPRGHEQIRDA